MNIKTIGIIGAGNFGIFMGAHLQKYFTVRYYDKVRSRDELGVVCSSDLVVFAVPFFSLEEAIGETQNLISEDTLICDVTSIKKKPLELLKSKFPNNQILGTHPIFGPQSGKDGIDNLPIVITNISATESTYDLVHSFLKKDLHLDVIEQSAEEHDQEMARIQGLTHFIGRALDNLNIKSYRTNTSSYQELLELKRLLKDDSWELFETIQNGNEYAQKIRNDFVTELNSLEEALDKS